MSNRDQDHAKSINKALDYIEQNLENDVSLDKVSKVAHYSPYHFHRIFKAYTNETLNQYIVRKRVEKASAILLRKKAVSISELSMQYGFTSNSSFTRAFKKFYGVSPSEFKKRGKGIYSKIRQTKSKIGQANTHFEAYVCDANQNTIQMQSNIEVTSINTIYTIGTSCIGVQNLSSTFQNVLEWAGPKGLLRNSGYKMATIYYDSFKITAPNKVRMRACLLVDKPMKTDTEMSLGTIDKGLHIIAHHEINIDEFERVWTEIFMYMNTHGYKMRDEPAFEIYHNDFNTHPEKKCIVDLYVPVI
ncbi:AraC family transcriptional regulator [Psychroserpens damuponensis]|uniref:AraC family transcriptional regulator n=1 Tax=Psychroserpens damuponensis TaxID=943936 RepID=UPI00058FFD38|nr:AraC family transcriptional regulator [Psychroserpens damuponensis]